MNKLTLNGINSARLHLSSGNEGAYARIMSSLHRAAPGNKLQREIEAEIAADGLAHLFMHLPNGAVIAKDSQEGKALSWTPLNVPHETVVMMLAKFGMTPEEAAEKSFTIEARDANGELQTYTGCKLVVKQND